MENFSFFAENTPENSLKLTAETEKKSLFIGVRQGQKYIKNIWQSHRKNSQNIKENERKIRLKKS